MESVTALGTRVESASECGKVRQKHCRHVDQYCNLLRLRCIRRVFLNDGLQLSYDGSACDALRAEIEHGSCGRSGAAERLRGHRGARVELARLSSPSVRADWPASRRLLWGFMQ